MDLKDHTGLVGEVPSQCSIKGKSNLHLQSEISNIIQQIVQNAEMKIRENQIIKKYLKTFSNNKTFEDINQVNSLFFNQVLLPVKKKEDEEPTPLYIDSLLPISADINAQNQKKKDSPPTLTQEVSLRFQLNKPVFSERGEKYLKLNVSEQSQEDSLVKQIRRVSQEGRRKQETQRKEKQKQLKMKLSKKNSKQEKICYNYDGTTLNLKMEAKKNLISTLVAGNTDPKSQIIRQAKNDLHPTVLQGVSSQKGKIKKNQIPTQISKKKDQIQFSNLNTLAENYKSSVGVKYTYEGKIYQEKKKIISTNEIKRSLSQKRLSKEEFAAIKKMSLANRQQFEENLPKTTPNLTGETKSQRAYSETKFTSIKRLKNLDSIHVINSSLKAKLIQKVNYLEQSPVQQTQRESQEKIRLGSIDSFNLQYLRTGGSIKTSTSRQYGDFKNSLPKISHTALRNHNRPKGRQRLKDGNQILRDLRKKFQQKLRV